MIVRSVRNTRFDRLRPWRIDWIVRLWTRRIIRIVLISRWFNYLPTLIGNPIDQFE